MKTRTLYKLTDENMRTYRGFQWELGKPRETDGRGDLCGPGWLHAYQDPLLAVLLNPIHANFSNPRLFKARGAGEFKDDRGLKCGVTKLTLVEEMPLPVVTTTQRVAFGILCAKRVCKDAAWNVWADAWLSGRERSAAAAEAAAAAAAWTVARAAAWAAVEMAEMAEAAWAAVEWAASGRRLPLRAIARKVMMVV